MAEIGKKVKGRKSPQKTLMVFVVILLVAVIAIQLFYPQKLDTDTGKVSRLGGKKKVSAPESADPVVKTEMNVVKTVIEPATVVV